MSSDIKLSGKRQRFLDEYLIDMNGTQAAIRAGYSKNCASQIAEEILRIPEVKQVLSEKLKEKQKDNKYDAKRIIAMHEEIYREAIKLKQLAPAVSAVKAITELLGIEAPQKHEVNHSGAIAIIERIIVDPKHAQDTDSNS